MENAEDLEKNRTTEITGRAQAKRVRAAMPLLLVCLLMMMMCPLYAQAAGLTKLYISRTGKYTTEAVDWQKRGSVYYLFMPSGMDTANVRIGFTGSDYITVNGKKVKSGDKASFLKAGQTLKVKCDGKTYTVKVMQGSVGSVHIVTQGVKNIYNITKSRAPKGSVTIIKKNGKTEYSGKFNSMRLRGNSSVIYSKRNYQIKLSQGANLFGMGKSKTWILSAVYRDESLLRNPIAFQLSAYAKMPTTIEYRMTDLYVNHEYRGTYMLSQKVQIDDDRININDLEAETVKLNKKSVTSAARVGASTNILQGQYRAYNIEKNPKDITGGYVVEYDLLTRSDGEASVYHLKHGNALVVKSPEYCSVKQMKYISTFMQGFENAIFASNGKDPATGKHYSQFIDMDSLVSMYIIEELMKDYDGNRTSLFFYKPSDKESKVGFAGPLWDLDTCCGNFSTGNARSATGFWINNPGNKSSWWTALCKHKDFMNAVKKKYKEVFVPALQALLGIKADSRKELKSIKAQASVLKGSAQMNFVRWPNASNNSSEVDTGKDFNANINQLTSWLKERYLWLNKQWL